MSKILITGNGFDLFHHLPTKYGHFMAIMKTIQQLKFKEVACYEDLFGKIFKEKFPEDYDSIIENFHVEDIKFNYEKIEDLNGLLKNNNWYNFFKTALELETWIDFETEIGKLLEGIISVFDQAKIGLYDNTQGIKIIPNQIRKDFFSFGFSIQTENKIYLKQDYIDVFRQEIKEKKILNELADSLEEFIIIFNKYLIGVVGVFYEVKMEKDIIPFDLMNEIYTFNYTPTIEKFYSIEKSKMIYLHGEMNEDSKIQNLVLGVSEIPENVKKHRMYNFAKYYQKIKKNSNKKFIDIPLENVAYNEETFFYIIGHSLDKSDQIYVLDLFKFLMEDKLRKSKICVFYYDFKDKENKIKNLLSIIDEKIVSKMNNEERLYFVELNKENINIEFNKKEYKKHYSFGLKYTASISESRPTYFKNSLNSQFPPLQLGCFSLN